MYNICCCYIEIFKKRLCFKEKFYHFKSYMLCLTSKKLINLFQISFTDTYLKIIMKTTTFLFPYIFLLIANTYWYMTWLS